MKAIRRFNNNVVLCVDDNGQEVIVFGKGVGFHELPYIVELNKVEKTYYGIENKYFQMLNSLSSESLEIARKVLDICRIKLKSDMNNNLLFTLADHIDFIVERYNKKIKVTMPLYYDFENLYPVEFEISESALKLIEYTFKIKLQKDEIVGIGMNIINAELNSITSIANNNTNEIIEDITLIIEKCFSVKVKRSSGNFARYVSHMQYLVERIDKKIIDDSAFDLYERIAEEYPKSSDCAKLISDYLLKKKQYKLSQSELIYLIIHINRLCFREECNQ